MPTIQVIHGLKAHKKAIHGLKTHKKAIHHNRLHGKHGGALKHLIPHSQAAAEEEYGTNLQKLRQSLKTMHIAAKPQHIKKTKRYVEI